MILAWATGEDVSMVGKSAGHKLPQTRGNQLRSVQMVLSGESVGILQQLHTRKRRPGTGYNKFGIFRRDAMFGNVLDIVRVPAEKSDHNSLVYNKVGGGINRPRGLYVAFQPHAYGGGCRSATHK